MKGTRIRVPAVSRLITLSMVTLMLAVPGIAAGQNWVSTGTQAVGPVLTNATSQGNLPDTTPIHVNVGLQIQNHDALVNYVKRISTPGDALYGQELEPADFAANYAPSTAQVQSVVSYLSGAGFQNVQTEPNNLMVSADGTAAAVRTAFNTTTGRVRGEWCVGICVPGSRSAGTDGICFHWRQALPPPPGGRAGRGGGRRRA